MNQEKEKKVMFCSSLHTSLVKCKKIDPSIRCMAVSAAPPFENLGYYVKSNGLDYCAPDNKKATKEMIDNCKKYGVDCYIGVIDDLIAFHHQAEKWDCEGLVTNYPAVFKSYLSSKK